MIPRKCIIDNWSLEQASFLVDSDAELELSKEKSLYYLGGLSNFIDVTLLYEEPYYIKNGFETGWKSSKWFKRNATVYIKEVSFKELNIPWKSKKSYKDNGVANYLLTSKHFESDLIVTPERATQIVRSEIPELKGAFLDALGFVDKLVLNEAEKLTFERARVDVKKNLMVPGLTQYVLREASNRDDLLKVIMQLRSDGKMKRIIEKVEEIASSTKGAGRLQTEIEKLVKKAFGRTQDTGSTSVTITAAFLSVGKNIDLNYFRRAEYLVFLRDLVSCRTEALKLKKDLKRVFGKGLKLRP